MKHNFKEYEEMVIQFNYRHHRWLFTYFPVVIGVILFVFLSVRDNDYFVNIITTLVFLFISNYASKKIIGKSAKQINRTKKIVAVENIIDTDKIIEKVYMENNIESCSELYYKDVLKIKEDKYNFYLYITNNSVIIINKQKLENIEMFRQLIKEKCVMIKK